MRKKINCEDVTFGDLRIPLFLTFECILPYWKLELARSLVNRSVVHVDLWDATKKNGINRRYFRKHTTPQNIAQGTLCISSFETSEYILPYWKLDKAKSLVNGNVKRVGVWDVTEEKYGRTNRYEDDERELLGWTLINDRGLGDGDEIWLWWNPIISKFMFELISRAVLID
ncbi:hypothetical protein H5410_028581 [Solanum commersonii]|uniref:Uncharacterized protein n=1 Tax=Solanum commersonii TaxID=4109 RepID=A0A9J5Z2I5_SOLCO|nr:hypothetical protein H5410_028581 [Solanum commersonii]